MRTVKAALSDAARRRTGAGPFTIWAFVLFRRWVPPTLLRRCNPESAGAALNAW